MKKQVIFVSSVLASLILALVGVSSGVFYRLAGEGRLLGLDEQPFWHAHEAAKFAAQPGMPDRLIAFHLGHAALFEFYKRDEQRTFCDPRLEVVSRDVMEEYHAIEQAIAEDRRGWQAMLARNGLELVLVDHRGHHAIEATLLTDPAWRCVHFDPVASVFLRAERAGTQFPAVDFARWHFEIARANGGLTPANIERSDSGWRQPRLIGDVPDRGGLTEEFVAAEALYKIARDLLERGSDANLARTMALLCFDHTRAGATRFSAAKAGWQFMAFGLLLQLDEVPSEPASPAGVDRDEQFIVQLELARVRYLLTLAWLADPKDFATLRTLFAVCELQDDRLGQVFFARKLLHRGARIQHERQLLNIVRTRLESLQRDTTAADADPRFTDPSAGLTQLVETSYSKLVVRDWQRVPVSEFAAAHAGLLLQLGEPGFAREVWEGRPAGEIDESLRQERIAATYWVECDYDAAIEHYQNSRALESKRLGARWGLMRCYLETGDAAGVVREAEAALENDGLSNATRRQIEWMRDLARPFAE